MKFLRGILGGAWVVGAPWVAACAQAGAPVPEQVHEVQRDSLGNQGGPILGRLQAAERNQLLRGFQVGVLWCCVRFSVTDAHQLELRRCSWLGPLAATARLRRC